VSASVAGVDELLLQNVADAAFITSDDFMS
jgi:hypothetical protein